MSWFLKKCDRSQNTRLHLIFLKTKQKSEDFLYILFSLIIQYIKYDEKFVLFVTYFVVFQNILWFNG